MRPAWSLTTGQRSSGQNVASGSLRDCEARDSTVLRRRSRNSEFSLTTAFCVLAVANYSMPMVCRLQLSPGTGPFVLFWPVTPNAPPAQTGQRMNVRNGSKADGLQTTHSGHWPFPGYILFTAALKPLSGSEQTGVIHLEALCPGFF